MEPSSKLLWRPTSIWRKGLRLIGRWLKIRGFTGGFTESLPDWFQGRSLSRRSRAHGEQTEPWERFRPEGAINVTPLVAASSNQQRPSRANCAGYAMTDMGPTADWRLFGEPMPKRTPSVRTVRFLTPKSATAAFMQLYQAIRGPVWRNPKAGWPLNIMRFPLPRD